MLSLRVKLQNRKRMVCQICALCIIDYILIHCRNGANVSVLEDGNNVIHLLAERTYQDQDMENDIILTYQKICDLINEKELSTLLKQKNSFGFTPLQWCLCHNAYGLYQLILNTLGTYVIKEQEEGAIVRRWYDVTENESMCNQDLSLDMLYGTIFVNRRNIEQVHVHTQKLFSSSFVKTYLKKKFNLNAFYIAFLVTLRIITFIFELLYLSCGQHVLHSGVAVPKNGTFESYQCLSWIISSDTAKRFLTLPVIVLLFVRLLFSMLYYLENLIYVYISYFRKKAYTELRKREYVVQYHSHILGHIIRCLCWVIMIINDFLLFYKDRPIMSNGTRQFLYINLGIAGCGSIFNLLILSRQTAWLIITVQRLSLDFVYFVVLFAIYIPSISLTLMSTAKIHPNNTTQPPTYISASYSALMAYLGSTNLTFFSPDFQFNVAYLCLGLGAASLTVTNFIIAVFSNSVATVMKNMEVLITIQQLAFISMVERQFTAIPGLGKLHKILQRKNFEEIDGRLALGTVSLY